MITDKDMAVRNKKYDRTIYFCTIIVLAAITYHKGLSHMIALAVFVVAIEVIRFAYIVGKKLWRMR